MVGDDRTLSALQAAVKALPTAPNGLRRCFGWSPPMTRPSPTPGSGGWPPGITPYRRCGRWRPTRLASATICGRCRCARRLGARFRTDYINLTIHDADTAALAYISALIDAGQFQDAHDRLAALPASVPASYVRAVLYSRTQRWPDVLGAVTGCAGWMSVDLGRAGSLLEAKAAANLKLLDRALAATDRAALDGESLTTSPAMPCSAGRWWCVTRVIPARRTPC